MNAFERQRRFHQRSRRGCLTCRKRRVRCDESQPVCGNCSRLDKKCSYGAQDPFVVVTTSAYQAMVTSPSPNDGTPNHLFIGIPVELDAASRKLFYIFAQKRASGQTPTPNTGESFVVRRAFAEPGYLHASIILGCMDSIWLGDTCENLKVPFLHHRGEAYRLVREELPLKKKSKETMEYTVATISILAALEGTFFGHDGFDDLRLVALHVKGIQQLLSLCPRRLPYYSPMQNLTLMVIERVSGDDMLSQLPIFIRTHHAIVSAIYYPKPVPIDYRFKDDARPRESSHRRKGEIWSQNSSNVREDSQLAFLVSFLYIYVKLPTNALSSYMLNWIVELLLEVLAKTESAVLDGQFDGEDWLWISVYGLAAAASVCLRGDDDRMQMMFWKPLFQSKVRWIKGVLGVENWQAATRVLANVRWDPGFEGEEEISRLWEEAESASY